MRCYDRCYALACCYEVPLCGSRIRLVELCKLNKGEETASVREPKVEWGKEPEVEWRHLPAGSPISLSHEVVPTIFLFCICPPSLW